MDRTKPMIVAIIAILLVACTGLVLFVSTPVADDGLMTGEEVTSLTGDFKNGILKTDPGCDKGFLITVDDGNEYDSYEWEFGYEYHTAKTKISSGEIVDYETTKIVKDSKYNATNPNELIWQSPSVNRCNISVKCVSEGKESTYGGSFDYIMTEYKWLYKGVSHSFSTSYEISEFLKYRDMKNDFRDGRSFSNIADFVVINDVVKDMSQKLAIEYGEGSDPVKDQSYAAFILTFVQMCFSYPNDSLYPDNYMNGVDDYWAYPMETIFFNMGDCEDTSILCAALYEEAGFDASVALVPGHAFVGVCLTDYEVPVTSIHGLSTVTQTVNGKTYYAGETTCDRILYPLGLVEEKTNLIAGEVIISESLGMETPKGIYGFYPVEDE